MMLFDTWRQYEMYTNIQGENKITDIYVLLA